jgi:hypothetical protein
MRQGDLPLTAADLSLRLGGVEVVQPYVLTIEPPGVAIDDAGFERGICLTARAFVIVVRWLVSRWR